MQHHLLNIPNLNSMLLNINIKQKQIKKQSQGPAFGLDGIPRIITLSLFFHLKSCLSQTYHAYET
jgi:hypothetical protein